MNVVTRHTTASVGTRLEFDLNGKIISRKSAPRQVGTTVVIQNIFHTLPVRHKEFMRNLKKEFGKLVQVLNAYCIINTGVRITCYNQTGKGSRNLVVSTNGNDTMRDNIGNVFSPKQLHGLLEFKQTEAEDEICTDFGINPQQKSSVKFRIEGFVSKCEHGQGRSSSDRQFIFINKRPCDSAKILKIINEVYHSYNRHQTPFIALNISMDKETVDVNVTPDKRQIFMEGERLLLAVLKTSLTRMFEPTSSVFKVNNILSSQSHPNTDQTLTSLSNRISSHQGSKPQASTPSMSSSLAQLKRSFSSAFDKNTSSSSPLVTSPIKRSSKFKSSSLPSQLKPTGTITQFLTRHTATGPPSPGDLHDSTCKDYKWLSESQSDLKLSLSEVLESDPYGKADQNESSPLSVSNLPCLADPVVKISCGKTEMKSVIDLCAIPDQETELQSSLKSCSDKLGSDDEKDLNNLSVGCCEEKSPDPCEEESPHPYDGADGETECHKNITRHKTAISPTNFETGSTIKLDLHSEKVVQFSLSSLQDRMATLNLENSKNQTSFCRSFRAKICPGDNGSAEDELQREISKDMFSKMEILGQFNLGFIITKLGSDLFIVDQHATDEKYNFEMLQRNTVLQSQRMIVPQSLELTASNETILMDNLDIFKKNGFDFLIEPEAPPTQRVKLTSAPTSKNWNFGKDDIEELLFMLTDSPNVMCRPTRIRLMFASRSCRKSVMIGTALNKSEMKRLVCHMGEIEQPWNCPHGRPTMRHLFNMDMLPS
ncbi:unnamed protein product [Lymnaea stagnalis]|uniref:Mismatch repair endonuclease PMS2 n=1 Tax=Lymnaea stagnalis TaxID=6523 RepID=A0AAV2H444_LYMST